MRRSLIALIPCLLTAVACAADLTADEFARYRNLDARPLSDFSNVDVAGYLPLRSSALASSPNRRSLGENVASLALKGLRQPYRLNAVRFDYGEGDCVCFVERALCLALTTDWDSYYRIRQRLTHKGGEVDYKNRNFSTLGDWVPNNSWLLRDLTPELPGARPFTHVVRPKVFEEHPAAPGSKYTRTIFKGSDYHSKNIEVRTNSYIPSEQMSGALIGLNTGDVALVLRDAAGGRLGCDHMGLILRAADGAISLVHSAPPQARLESLLSFLARFKQVRGLMFLRLRADAADQVAAELPQLVSMNVPLPDEEDTRVLKLRTSRQASAATTLPKPIQEAP